jgi:hypothetical protein
MLKYIPLLIAGILWVLSTPFFLLPAERYFITSDLITVVWLCGPLVTASAAAVAVPNRWAATLAGARAVEAMVFGAVVGFVVGIFGWLVILAYAIMGYLQDV